MDKIKSAAAMLGKLGGKAGKGESKRRGDSEHYRKLRAMRGNKTCSKCGGSTRTVLDGEAWCDGCQRYE